MIENVVLIDEADATLGEGEKLAVHRSGALHRAFSVFAFNAAGELLLQRRALSKYHSGGLWTNSCCGHPRPGEATADAAAPARLVEELGIELRRARARGRLRYRAEIDDLVENELDHLLVTTVADTPYPNPDEVVEWRFVALDELTRGSTRAPRTSPPGSRPPGAWSVHPPDVLLEAVTATIRVIPPGGAELIGNTPDRRVEILSDGTHCTRRSRASAPARRAPICTSTASTPTASTCSRAS